MSGHNGILTATLCLAEECRGAGDQQHGKGYVGDEAGGQDGSGAMLKLLAFVLPGLALGAKIAERWRERAERLAGITLILLGLYLIAEQIRH